MVDLDKIGWCVVSLSQPMGATRFYGPFDSGITAKLWIGEQPEQTRDYFWIVPLRKTEIHRTHDDFYNPSQDSNANDFWG